MLEILFNYFHKNIADYETYKTPSLEELDSYKGLFLAKTDEVDLMFHLLKENGYCSINNGLIWTVEPNLYTEVARTFPGISKTALVFARSYTGCLFIWDKLKIGESIIHLNIHTGKSKIISTGFQVFLPFNITSKSFLERECYGKIELAAQKKHGLIQSDECYSFVPALAIGGSEKISEMKKVKILPQLKLLGQLHSK